MEEVQESRRTKKATASRVTKMRGAKALFFSLAIVKIASERAKWAQKKGGRICRQWWRDPGKRGSPLKALTQRLLYTGGLGLNREVVKYIRYWRKETGVGHSNRHFWNRDRSQDEAEEKKYLGDGGGGQRERGGSKDKIPSRSRAKGYSPRRERKTEEIVEEGCKG